jgi:hypothetical protein
LSAFEPEKIMESTRPATVSTPPMMAHDLESACQPPAISHGVTSRQSRLVIRIEGGTYPLQDG